MSKATSSVRPARPWWRHPQVRKYGYALAIGLAVVNLTGDLRGLWQRYQELDRHASAAKLARLGADHLRRTG